MKSSSSCLIFATASVLIICLQAAVPRKVSFVRSLAPIVRHRLEEGHLPAALVNELISDFEDKEQMDFHGAEKRQFDDYGHMRFGKRGDGEFDDYGHLRFGRSPLQEVGKVASKSQKETTN